MTRLKELREKSEKKETQEEIANLLGITRGAYANIENGKREPDIATIKTMAKYYEVTIDYLLCYSNEPYMHELPPELSLKNITNPALKKRRLKAIIDWTRNQDSVSIRTYFRDKELPLSDRALQIALAYDIAEDDEVAACEFALKRHLNPIQSPQKELNA